MKKGEEERKNNTVQLTQKRINNQKPTLVDRSISCKEFRSWKRKYIPEVVSSQGEVFMIEAGKATGATASQGSDNKSIITTFIPTLVQTSTALSISFFPPVEWISHRGTFRKKQNMKSPSVTENLDRLQVHQDPDLLYIKCCHFEFVTHGLYYFGRLMVWMLLLRIVFISYVCQI